MKTLLKKQIARILKKFGIGITRYKTLEELRHKNSAIHDIKILRALYNDNNAHLLLKYYGSSKSQFRQDLFALSCLDFKKNGYFVEFGATNGLDFSNTYLMEKEFGWNGILAEPATVWHNSLIKNRKCNIEFKCVWNKSNSILTFNQVAAAELSTISSFSGADSHKDARKNCKIYNVETISLSDLLLKYNAPNFIDYLSIDTEGSEYEVLRNFDFSKYTFGVITCEHNFTVLRNKIYSLLTKHGYQRVFEDLSLYDDWYVKPAQRRT